MLEYVNAATLPCGCRFLLAWEELRDAVTVDGKTTFVERPMPEVYEPRIVTRDEAEAVAQAKRDDPAWAPFITTNAQPETILCPAHEALGYSAATFRQAAEDGNAAAAQQHADEQLRAVTQAIEDAPADQTVDPVVADLLVRIDALAQRVAALDGGAQTVSAADYSTPEK